MTPITIKISGQEKVLKFNKFANVELYKVIFENPFANPEMGELLDKCNEILQSNQILFYRTLIYAGIVGNDYASGKFKPSVTIEEISELVGNMSEDEFAEFFQSVWYAFFDAMGANLENVKQLADEEPEKKK